jgi:hypothetical protein
MNRKQADAAFESLRRHASAITEPTTPADALKLLDRAVLTQLQRDAIVHYIAVGPDNLPLAYSVLKAGAATFASARFAALDGDDQPSPPAPPAKESAQAAQAAQAADRELFATRMIALAEDLEGAEPAARGARLLDAFTGHVATGRRRWSPPPREAGAIGAASPAGERSGDLLEAAGIAYVIAQLLESPPRPAPTPR